MACVLVRESECSGAMGDSWPATWNGEANTHDLVDLYPTPLEKSLLGLIYEPEPRPGASGGVWDRWGGGIVELNRVKLHSRNESEQQIPNLKIEVRRRRKWKTK